MSVVSFLKLVEIQTKVASIIPFLLATFYTIYRYNTFNAKNFLLMLVSLLCIDMVTTAINNYQDYKNANKRQGFGYEQHNAIVRYHLKESVVLTAILVLLVIAVIFGILLYINTNIIVLILGAISFMIGILYSFGPIPISRTPFGEIFSGGAMGFLIPFIAVYIHIYDQNLISLILNGTLLEFKVNIVEILYVFLVSVPCIAGIGNIMLANNICDMEDDIENHRYTLPVYIGKNNALLIFKAAYYISYIVLIVLLVLKVIPLLSAVTLFTFILVYKNIKIFDEKQSKKDTFVLAVKNFVIMNTVLAFTIGLTLILGW